MKNLLIIFCALALTVGAHAQTSFKSAYNSASDTIKVTNTEVGILTVRNAGPATSCAIIYTVTKVSGTAGGTVLLQGSFDNVNWVNVNSPYTQTAVTAPTIANASGVYAYWMPANPFPYYRITHTGTGTMVITASAKILSR